MEALQKRMGLVWAIIAVMFLLAYLMLEHQVGLATFNRGRLDVRYDETTAVTTLTWRSGVEAPMARRFQEAYDETRDQTRRYEIVLDSNGGALAEGRRVINILNAMKRDHQVDTFVGARDKCLSMCVPIFLQGETRRGHARSRWMFHQPTAYDSVTGEKASVSHFEKQMTAEIFFDRYFVQSPMAPDWRDDLARQWVGRDVWKTGQELWDEGSGVLTDLEQ